MCFRRFVAIILDIEVTEQRWTERKTVCQVGGRCGSPCNWRHLLMGHVEPYLILLWRPSPNAFGPFELNAFILYGLSRCRWKVLWDGNVTKSSVLSSDRFNCLCAVKHWNWHSRSIATTFKWGNIRGDTAALVPMQIFSHSIKKMETIQPLLVRDLEFLEQTSAQLNLAAEFLCKRKFGPVPWLDAQHFKYSKELYMAQNSMSFLSPGRGSPGPSSPSHTSGERFFTNDLS